MKKTLLLYLLLITSTLVILGQPAEFDYTPNNKAGGIIATVEINGIPASSDDWIAAFDENANCAGAVQLVDYGGQTYCNLQVYGNDFTTYDIDEGIDVGETFTFMLWIAATNQFLGYAMDISPVTGWNAGLNGSPVPGWDFSDGAVLNFIYPPPPSDTDGDGFFSIDDPDDNDPCNPDNNAVACDTDGDGTPNGSDPDEADPCIPNDNVTACDTDGDGIPDGSDLPVEFNFTPTSTSGGIIAVVQVNGMPASTADWLAAFDEDGNCAGAVELITYNEQTYGNLQIYGDDFTTDIIDEGINVEETFTFKLWVAATNQILEHPMHIPPVSGWNAGLNGSAIPGWNLPDGMVLNFGGPPLTDEDEDGFFAEINDPDDTDPCIPDDNIIACDTNGDGIPDGLDPFTPPSEFDFTPNNTSGGIIATVQVNGFPASSDNWIAAFDEDSNCAGAVQLIDYGGQTYCYLQVYGNDFTTDNIDEGIDAGETFTFKLWVAATYEILDHPMDVEPVSGWDAGLNGSPIPGYEFEDGVVLRFYRSGGPGGEDDTDGDGIPDVSDQYPDCNGMPDECGVCNGPGIAAGTCDCEGTLPATWYSDVDGDGLGDPNNPVESCEQPNGFVSNNNDTTTAEPSEIPTLSQWGLILLSLILLSITTVSIIQNKYSLAHNNGALSSASVLPYFDAALLRRMLLQSIPFMLIIFVLISFIEDGWFIRNLVGTVFSVAIVVYLLHFIILSESFNTK